MKDNKVGAVSVDEWLANLRSQEWQIPQFQRDFVWTIAECADFAQSVLAGRPIGMVTIWEQPDDSELKLEPITITSGNQEISFAAGRERPNRYYAVLDGRQRSQAAAMTFGGLRARDRRSRFAGRFFLDTTDVQEFPKVIFLTDSAIEKRSLRREADFIASGLFPLASDDSDEGIVSRWVRYVTMMHDASTYPAGQVPSVDVLSTRKERVQESFDGLTRTRLAVYTVPSRYQLGEICEIFETLNTTGTKVSTVDLIHSWLFADTSDFDQPMLLREWIDEVGEMEGAVGWASKSDRPELFVQLVAGCYLAQDDPPSPRKSSGSPKRIASIKASDLLALPTVHWLAARDRAPAIASALRDFQRVVGDGDAAFPYALTPYPVTAGLYVGLRWKLETEPEIREAWTREHLDSLFRAFFWQNALKGRYDQGFLTKFTADLRFLAETLALVRDCGSRQAWCAKAEDLVSGYLGGPAIDDSSLTSLASDGRVAGALEKALSLPMRCRVKRDLLDPEIDLTYPDADSELHHIFPRQWCKDNKYGALRDYLELNAQRDPVSAIANLMPLGRSSNSVWRAKNPRAVFEERSIAYNDRRDILRAAFIDEAAFSQLLRGSEGVIDFWDARRKLIVADMLRRTHVSMI